ncbi:hypothetical protein CCMSSC00406_0003051 [Pleurotus cornucopiae]|uniref:Uncharacterized protein n=1 Tax=Pleurotus cornucopiae TaxID=5321 RepID=A0ACB7J4P4_PLECO|nr:hypothetical protein CCMSSC00406_0003051 [Pleurotus cornucopiae]
MLADDPRGPGVHSRVCLSARPPALYSANHQTVHVLAGSVLTGDFRASGALNRSTPLDSIFSSPSSSRDKSPSVRVGRAMHVFAFAPRSALAVLTLCPLSPVDPPIGNDVYRASCRAPTPNTLQHLPPNTFYPIPIHAPNTLGSAQCPASSTFTVASRRRE